MINAVAIDHVYYGWLPREIPANLSRISHYGYSGHVLNLPQDIATFTKRLPRLSSELDVIIVRKEGATGSHKDIRVKKSVVLRALEWLIEHNMYYRNITIDHSALALLPTNGDLTNLPTMRMSSDEEEIPAREDETPYNSHLGSTFIPMPTRGVTEKQALEHSIEQTRSVSPAIVPWPSASGNPINEFTTEGYISCAFPTLFPTGLADFVYHVLVLLLLAITLNISCCIMTEDLPNIHVSGIYKHIQCT